MQSQAAASAADAESRETAIRTAADSLAAAQKQLDKRRARLERREERCAASQMRAIATEKRLAECIKVVQGAVISLGGLSLPQISADIGLTVYAALRNGGQQSATQASSDQSSFHAGDQKKVHPALVSASALLQDRVRGGASSALGRTRHTAEVVHIGADSQEGRRGRRSLRTLTSSTSDSESSDDAAPRAPAVRSPEDAWANHEAPVVLATEDQLRGLIESLSSQVRALTITSSS